MNLTSTPEFLRQKHSTQDSAAPAKTSAHGGLELKTRIFGLMWRLAILILPLQTRFFSEASLSGWPFEQGRLSFYISWLPMITAVALGYFLPKTELPKKLNLNIFLLFALLGGLTIATTPIDIHASAMWWVQIFLLSAFFITLLRAKVNLKNILFWFILSLIPQAIFAVAQFFLQYVPGSSLLGVAAQDPKSLGVSVIQVADMRFLRAYGAFPHPNILGGFMAFGALLSAWLYSQKQKSSQTSESFQKLAGESLSEKKQAPSPDKRYAGLVLLAALPIFSSALFYSFSRSAWLAFMLGMITLVVFTLIKKDAQKKLVIKPLSAVLLTLIPLSIIHIDLTASRLGLSPALARLEVQSIDARSDSITNGIKVFQTYPVFGTGPNAELPALAKLTSVEESESMMPLEPPHNVFIIILANWGVAGSLIIFGFSLFLLRRILKKWSQESNLKPVAISLMASWLVISLFDHYPYSLWPGQYLSLLTAFILISWLNSEQKLLESSETKNPQTELDGSIE